MTPLDAAISDAPLTSEQRHIVRELQAGRVPWWGDWRDAQLEDEGVVTRTTVDFHHSYSLNRQYGSWGLFSIAPGRIRWMLSTGNVRERVVRMPRRRKAIPGHVRRVVFERDGYACTRCGSLVDLELDHVYPHAKGGSDEPGNLQSLCGGCNRAKGDALPRTDEAR